MNLLIVSFPCAIPTNQRLFAEVENQKDWNITIVAPPNWKTGFDEVKELERSPEFSGDLRPVPVWLSGNIPLHIYKSSFLSLLRSIDPDAIYVHHEAYGLATAQVYLANWILDQKPIGFYSAQNIKKKYPPPFRYLEGFVHSQSSFSFPITESVLGVLREKGYDGPATILPLGVDCSFYTPDETLSRQKLCPDPDTRIIGYVGRIDQMKGLSTLLNALDHLEDEDCHLVLIGSGPDEDRFVQLADSLGLQDQVTFLGYIDHAEIPSYLATLDVLVLPSETQPDWKEQFGRVIIEALACGTPVVGSDSGSIPHLVRDTEGGLVFPEGDAGTLADRLQTLIDRPERRRELASRGQKVVREKYSNSALAERFATTIERAVENGGGGPYV
jgi:glycosyltransferase involved in cell wall biosynthesis